MQTGDYGEECLNCQCWSCTQNDINNCTNCEECNGNIDYNKWMIDCDKYIQCQHPE